ncbi:hypothetical protein L1049_009268 [Liquidambar formosana]|uniref:Rho termination factor N-terminal domain-containing protein n=1 Tax=Liquidambar formosana TaxID=63359 RepID=A0AAP0S4I7_LIQFO
MDQDLRGLDWDLWGPSNYQVPEISYCTPHGCQCGFYFDVLEETAKNEKACVHLLRILMTEADTEIDELEKDLVVLQSQLAWVEYEDWSEKCCTALTEKIDCLNISISSLRNENEHDINVHLLVHREPAERIHEIVKALLKNYCKEKDEQPLDVIIKESAADALECATELSDEGKKLSNFDSNIIIKEEIEEPIISPTEKCTVLNLSFKPQGNETDCPETVKPADVNVRSSTVVASKNVTDHSNGKKLLINSDSTIIREEVEEEHTEILTVDSSLKPGEKRTDLEGKSAVNTTKDSSSGPLREATGNSNVNNNLGKAADQKNNLGKSESEVNKKEEVKGQNSTGSNKNMILKGTDLAKIDKPANAIVKDSSSDALRHATGSSGKKKLINSATRLDDFGQAKLGYCSVKPKRSTSTLKTTPNEGIKESKVALANKKGSSDLSLKTEGKKMKHPRKVTPLVHAGHTCGTTATNRTSPFIKVQNADLTDTENYAVTSLLEMQVERGKDTTKPILKEEGISQPDEVEEIEIVANAKTNLNLALKSQRHKARRKIQSNHPSVQEPGSLPIEIGSKSSSISKAKKRHKSGIGDDNATLVQFLKDRIWKKLVQADRCGAEESGVDPSVRKNSDSQSQKKRKTSSDMPIIVEIKDLNFLNDLLKSHGNTIDSASKEDNPITKSCSIDNSDTDTVASLPPSRLINLNDLTVKHLRAIAKEHKMPKYHKLRRLDLIELIANELR